MTERKFSFLYQQVKKKTNNFSEILPEVISSNPQYIRVFRMLCNKGLEEMGKSLGKTHATIAQYERGAIKSIPIQEAKKFSELIKDGLPNEKSFEIAIENFKKFNQLSSGGYLQAFKRAEKAELTVQENKIKRILEKNNKNFEIHKTLNTSIGPLNFDFWFPKEKIVIECTESQSKHKAECLGFRIIKLKDKYNCKSVAISLKMFRMEY